jgi:NAD(P)H-nitrite reductase large subunit/Pyruvate/2-oxoacid:ferredoxin oxidoreductase delta subunit
VFACKSGALARDPDTGAIRCDEDRCVGCWMCVMVCPLSSLRPSGDGVAAKCDLCADRGEPVCVAACPTQALQWEEVDAHPSPRVPEESGGLTHVIIGASAAGVAAAEAIRDADAGSTVKVISEESDPLYSRPMLYLDLLHGRKDVRFRSTGFFENLGIEPILGRRVEAIDPGRRRVRLDDGEEIDFDRLLIATGGLPRWPSIPGVEKKGVLGFRTLADLCRLSDLASSAQAAVVLGGGNVGLQAACGLREKGLEVTIVVKSPHLLSQLADEEAGRMFEERFASHGVVVRTGTDVVEILGKETVEGARLDTGETLPCGIVVAAKGVDANLAVLQGVDIDAHWGIRVNDRMETSISGIWAAGDVAQAGDIITGEEDTHGIWPVAFEQGRIAGLNMMGLDRPYDGGMRMNAAEFYGLELISLGIVRPKEHHRILIRRVGADVYRKLVFDGGILVGALLVGEIQDAGVLRLLMKKKIDLTSHEERLLDSADWGWLYPVLSREEWFGELVSG